MRAPLALGAALALVAVCRALLALASAPAARRAATATAAYVGPAKARPPKPLGTDAKEAARRTAADLARRSRRDGRSANELGVDRPGRPARRASASATRSATGSARSAIARHPARLRSRRHAARATTRPPTTASTSSSRPGSPTRSATSPYGFVTILNGIWLGLIFVLKLVLDLLGLAFGLNPFCERADDEPDLRGDRPHLLAASPTPGSATLIVCGGIWFAYKGLLQREVAAGVGGHAGGDRDAGRRPLGRPPAARNRSASSPTSPTKSPWRRSAPRSRARSRRPIGSYAEAMSRTWSRLVEVPFAGLDFSDVQLGARPTAAGSGRNAPMTSSATTSAPSPCSPCSPTSAAEERQGSLRATSPRKRYGSPSRVIDLYLRSSPGSRRARSALGLLRRRRHATRPKSPPRAATAR